MGFKFQNFDFLNLDSGFSEDELLVRRTARDFVEDNIVPIIEECFREGRFHIEGRKRDMIISGGVNVYPAEVENVLAAVDGIAEVAVFGLPDEQWGQRVCAAYVADGRRGSSAEEALRAAATARLAPYKRPKSYFATTDLPHTATGKLVRRAVPEHLGLGLSG